MKIILLGYGKMGHEVEKIALQRGHEILARIDNENDWNSFKSSAAQHLSISASQIVAVEFSTPATAFANIQRCFNLNIPVVCGTTAWYDHFNEVKEQCEKENQALFYAPNFSIGMNIMFMLNQQLATRFVEFMNMMSLGEAQFVIVFLCYLGKLLVEHEHDIHSDAEVWCVVSTRKPTTNTTASVASIIQIMSSPA